MNYAMPAIMLEPEHTTNGTIYHPANVKAKDIAKLMARIITDKDLPLIDNLGFVVMMKNGQPILRNKDAYKQELDQRPRHIRDLI
jgi:hypothetical protein